MNDAYAEVVRLGKELSNWGRWGVDDEIGTLNLIDRAAVRRGATSVVDGRAFTLALPLGEEGPHTNTIPGRFNPHHYMTDIGTAVPASPFFHFSDDVVVLPLNAATQWDSLAHVFYENQLYNGYPAGDALGTGGASRNGIDRQATHAFATRGLLLDAARHRGVDRLGPGEAVGADELDAMLTAAGVTPEPGDVLLVRTGFMRAFTVDHDRTTFNGSSPGLGLSAARWLHGHQFAAVATDTVQVEVTPSEDGETICPLHLVTIRDMGMLLGEMFVLDELADACQTAGRWTFQFVAPPLPFSGGISSPINPVAIL